MGTEEERGWEKGPFEEFRYAELQLEILERLKGMEWVVTFLNNHKCFHFQHWINPSKSDKKRSLSNENVFASISLQHGPKGIPVPAHILLVARDDVDENLRPIIERNRRKSLEFEASEGPGVAESYVVVRPGIRWICGLGAPSSWLRWMALRACPFVLVRPPPLFVPVASVREVVCGRTGAVFARTLKYNSKESDPLVDRASRTLRLDESDALARGGLVNGGEGPLLVPGTKGARGEITSFLGPRRVQGWCCPLRDGFGCWDSWMEASEVRKEGALHAQFASVAAARHFTRALRWAHRDARVLGKQKEDTHFAALVTESNKEEEGEDEREDDGDVLSAPPPLVLRHGPAAEMIFDEDKGVRAGGTGLVGLAYRVQGSFLFEAVVLMFIILNVAVLSTATDASDSTRETTGALELVCSIVFTVEAVIKMIAAEGLFPYLDDPWNAFDFILVAVGWISEAVAAAGGGAGVQVTAFRAFRALRVLRTLRFAQGLRDVVDTFVATLPLVGRALLVFAWFVVVFAVLGMDLFGDGLNRRCALPAHDATPPPVGDVYSLWSTGALSANSSVWNADKLPSVLGAAGFHEPSASVLDAFGQGVNSTAIPRLVGGELAWSASTPLASTVWNGAPSGPARNCPSIQSDNTAINGTVLSPLGGFASAATTLAKAAGLLPSSLGWPESTDTFGSVAKTADPSVGQSGERCPIGTVCANVGPPHPNLGFHSFGSAFMTVWRLSARAPGAAPVFAGTLEATSAWASLYFLGVLCLVSFLVLSLFVAIVRGSFVEVTRKRRAMRAALQNIASTTGGGRGDGLEGGLARAAESFRTMVRQSTRITSTMFESRRRIVPAFTSSTSSINNTNTNTSRNLQSSSARDNVDSEFPPSSTDQQPSSGALRITAPNSGRIGAAPPLLETIPSEAPTSGAADSSSSPPASPSDVSGSPAASGSGSDVGSNMDEDAAADAEARQARKEADQALAPSMDTPVASLATPGAVNDATTDGQEEEERIEAAAEIAAWIDGKPAPSDIIPWWQRPTGRVCCCMRPMGPIVQTVRSIILHPDFDATIIFLIIANTVALALEHYGASRDFRAALAIAEVVFSFFFLCELVLKVIGLGGLYPYILAPGTEWNRFDAIVVVASIVDITTSVASGTSELYLLVPNQEPIDAVGGVNLSLLRVFRLVRVLRVLRVLRANEDLRRLLYAITSSGPDLAALLVFLTVVILSFAVLGMRLFGGKLGDPPPRAHFDNLGDAMLTLFRMLAGGGTWAIFFDLLDAPGGVGDPVYPFITSLYFFAYTTFSSLVTLNFLVVIILSRLAMSPAERTKKLRERTRMKFADPANRRRLGLLDLGAALAKRIKMLSSEESHASHVYERGDVSAEAAASKSVAEAVGAGVDTPGLGLDEANEEADEAMEEQAEVESLTGEAVAVQSARNPDSNHSHPSVPEPPPVTQVTGTAVLSPKPLGKAPALSSDDAEEHLSSMADDSERHESKQETETPKPTIAVDAPPTMISHPSRGPAPRLISRATTEALRREAYEKDEDAEENDAREGCCSQTIKSFCGCLCSIPKHISNAQQQRCPDRGLSLGCMDRKHPFRKLMRETVRASWFENLILVCILLSSASLAFDSPTARDADPAISLTLLILDIIFLVVFTVEAFCKIIAAGFIIGRKAYLHDSWNVLDFIVLVLSLASTLGGLGAVARVGRLGRVLRPLRAIRRNPGMRVVVNALLRSLPAVIYTVILLLFFFFVFAVLGVNIFSGQLWLCTDATVDGADDCKGRWLKPVATVAGAFAAAAPQAPLLVPRAWTQYSGFGFDSVPQGIQTLFEVATLRAWPPVLYALMDARGVQKQPMRDANPAVALFLVVFIFIGAFYMMKLFVGIIVGYFRQFSGTALLSERQQEWAVLRRVVVLSKPTPGAPEDPIRKICFWIVVNPWSSIFEAIEGTIITVHLVLVGVLSSDGVQTESLDTVHWVFVALYVVGFWFRVMALGVRGYFKSEPFWATFDVISLLAMIILPLSLGPVGRQGVGLARALRFGRLPRLLGQSKGLAMLLGVIEAALPAIGNVTALLALVIFVYAVLGVQLFATTKYGQLLGPRISFRNFPDAFWALVQVIAGENWIQLMRDASVSPPACIPGGGGWDSDCGYSGISELFFYTFYLLTFAVFLNLYVASILDAYVVFKAGRRAIVAAGGAHDEEPPVCQTRKTALTQLEVMDAAHDDEGAAPGQLASVLGPSLDEDVAGQLAMDMAVDAAGGTGVVSSSSESEGEDAQVPVSGNVAIARKIRKQRQSRWPVRSRLGRDTIILGGSSPTATDASLVRTQEQNSPNSAAGHSDDEESVYSFAASEHSHTIDRTLGLANSQQQLNDQESADSPLSPKQSPKKPSHHHHQPQAPPILSLRHALSEVRSRRAERVQLKRGERGAGAFLHPGDVASFSVIWSMYDPKGTSRIPATQLPSFLRSLWILNNPLLEEPAGGWARTRGVRVVPKAPTDGKKRRERRYSISGQQSASSSVHSSFPSFSKLRLRYLCAAILFEEKESVLAALDPSGGPATPGPERGMDAFAGAAALPSEALRIIRTATSSANRAHLSPEALDSQSKPLLPNQRTLCFCFSGGSVHPAEESADDNKPATYTVRFVTVLRVLSELRAGDDLLEPFERKLRRAIHERDLALAVILQMQDWLRRRVAKRGNASTQAGPTLEGATAPRSLPYP